MDCFVINFKGTIDNSQLPVFGAINVYPAEYNTQIVIAKSNSEAEVEVYNKGNLVREVQSTVTAGETLVVGSIDNYSIGNALSLTHPENIKVLRADVESMSINKDDFDRLSSLEILYGKMNIDIEKEQSIIPHIASHINLAFLGSFFVNDERISFSDSNINDIALQMVANGRKSGTMKVSGVYYTSVTHIVSFSPEYENGYNIQVV